jgi:glutaminase
MQTIPRSNTQAAWRGLIAVLAVLLVYPLPAWSRSGIDPDLLGHVLQAAHALFADNVEGANADYIPELARVDPELFGLALVTTDGAIFTAGDAEHVFTIQSGLGVFK